jgi:hypothetical protein
MRKRPPTCSPGRTSASGFIELAPFEFLDRLADLIPQPRRHRHRYHGVFLPNHPLRPAVTALAVGNVGKRREAVTGRYVAEACCGTHATLCSHDTSPVAWAEIMDQIAESFLLRTWAQPSSPIDLAMISWASCHFRCTVRRESPRLFAVAFWSSPT